MGSAALATAAEPYPGKATRIFSKGQRSTKTKNAVYTVTTRTTSCIKMDSGNRRLVNASLTVRCKVKSQRQCPQTTTFEEKG